MTAYPNSYEMIQPTISGFSGVRAKSARTSFAGTIVAKVSMFLNQYWGAYQTKAQLGRLSDRSLSDIGIERDKIDAVANRRYSGDLVRHSDLGTLLAMSDEDLADIGVSRGDLEEFKAGRVKFVRRRLAA
ncbi:hypothetical protein N825_20080 [Skermanella stibiiresistens SB22]|uniref:YjiS-like domain-containing protein n=1 Tax=Skermanella stibiiresistens SB22 TaxID=1385369 RepID=W9HCA7_9PROT|nr:DUF1127 domain-containing protein [Skermanella stibiiresistens]EWY42361.1 hypothetical protein N825_20080 [Skermanella stibiiresistens SB22]